MKALGIVASPRKGKMTDKLVSSSLKSFGDKGFGTEKVYLADLSIKPCTGCAGCQKTGRCVIEDDFQKLSLQFTESDVVIFGSPTYFSGVTSLAKAFIDRGYSMFRENPFGLTYLHKKPKMALLITSCDAPFPFSHLLGLSTGCVKGMKVFFRYMKLKIKTFTVANSRGISEKKEERVLKKIYDICKNI